MRIIKDFFGFFMFLCILGAISLWQIAQRHPNLFTLIVIGGILWFTVTHFRLVAFCVITGLLIWLGLNL